MKTTKDYFIEGRIIPKGSSIKIKEKIALNFEMPMTLSYGDYIKEPDRSQIEKLEATVNECSNRLIDDVINLNDNKSYEYYSQNGSDSIKKLDRTETIARRLLKEVKDIFEKNL